jgi:signal transduction histidine kinase
MNSASTATQIAPVPTAAPAEQNLFTAALHHGRNLVMSTRGYAELIASREVPAEKQGEWAGCIVRNLDRLEELCTRLEELLGDERADGDRVSLALAVDCACRQAVRQARARGVDARFDLQLEADPLVVANAQLLCRAIAAFAENAIEADPQQTARIHLIRTEDGSWSLRIEDRGAGIEEQDHDRFGEAFFSRKAGRMGMGVYIGRSLLERLNLEFSLTTVPQRGTRITIQPRRRR